MTCLSMYSTSLPYSFIPWYINSPVVGALCHVALHTKGSTYTSLAQLPGFARDSRNIIVVRPSFPMMTITSSIMMMMMMSCLVDPVGAELANQSNSGLKHSSTLGAWVCRAG